jgi:hypothetical protein
MITRGQRKVLGMLLYLGFGGCWVLAGLFTVLLFYWAQELPPFNPAGRASEGAIIFFPVMLIRWGLLAVCLGIVTWLLARGLGGWWKAGLLGAVLAVHGVLGVVNVMVLNAWFSVTVEKTAAVEKALVATFFGLPGVMMLVTLVALGIVVLVGGRA